MDMSDNHLLRFAGLDLARIRDHSALVVIEITEDKDNINDSNNKIITVIDAIEYPHMTLDKLAEMIKSKYEKYKWVTLLIDATGFGGAIAYDILRKYMDCKALVFTNNIKNQMVSNLITLVANKKIRIPKEHKRLIEQMLEQRIISDSSSIKYRHPSNKNDDLFWALCLACFACKDMLNQSYMKIASKKFYQQENIYGKYDAIYFRW
jgi:phage FluMu gp28-like protein